MGTRLKRNDFKIQYPSISQGLFIFEKEKHIPPEVRKINLGQELSKSLLQVKPATRKLLLEETIQHLVEPYTQVALANIEILFTPSLETNPVALMRSLCRNKKICVIWPGKINETTLIYECPGCPEYYDENVKNYIDTYIVSGGI